MADKKNKKKHQNTVHDAMQEQKNTANVQEKKKKSEKETTMHSSIGRYLIDKGDK